MLIFGTIEFGVCDVFGDSFKIAMVHNVHAEADVRTMEQAFEPNIPNVPSYVGFSKDELINSYDGFDWVDTDDESITVLFSHAAYRDKG